MLVRWPWRGRLNGSVITFGEPELIEKFDGQNGGHDFGETGDFPLMPLPESNIFVYIRIIEQPAGAGNV